MLRLFFILTLSFLSLGAKAKDSIFIKVGDGSVRKSMLAVPPFQFFGSTKENADYQRVGAELYKVIHNDLDTSYLFDFVSQKAYIEDPAKTNIRPFPADAKGFRFENWRSIGTEFPFKL